MGSTSKAISASWNAGQWNVALWWIWTLTSVLQCASALGCPWTNDINFPNWANWAVTPPLPPPPGNWPTCPSSAATLAEQFEETIAAHIALTAAAAAGSLHEAETTLDGTCDWNANMAAWLASDPWNPRNKDRSSKSFKRECGSTLRAEAPAFLLQDTSTEDSRDCRIERDVMLLMRERAQKPKKRKELSSTPQSPGAQLAVSPAVHLLPSVGTWLVSRVSDTKADFSNLHLVRR